MKKHFEIARRERAAEIAEAKAVIESRIRLAQLGVKPQGRGRLPGSKRRSEK